MKRSSHNLELVEVPGTNGEPFLFGHRNQRAIEVAPFYISTTQVTQALWVHVMGSNPAARQDLRCPVENVSWKHVTEPGGFLDRLNASEIRQALNQDNPQMRFRLPSETEWEYAARGGPSWKAGFIYSGSNPCDERRLRGGCHHNWNLHCTVFWRYGITPDAHDGCIGFRVVLS